MSSIRREIGWIRRASGGLGAVRGGFLWRWRGSSASEAVPLAHAEASACPQGVPSEVDEPSEHQEWAGGLLVPDGRWVILFDGNGYWHSELP